MVNWLPGYDPLVSFYGLEYDGVLEKSTVLADTSLDVSSFSMGFHISSQTSNYNFPITHKTLNGENPTDCNYSQWFLYSWEGFLYSLVHGESDSILLKTILPVCKTENLVHIVCTYNELTREPRVFINGQSALTVIVSSLPLGHPSVETTLVSSLDDFTGMNPLVGCDIVFASGDPFPNSSIAEWHNRFFKGRVLSDSEIYDIYEAIKPNQTVNSTIVFSSDIVGDSIFRLYSCDVSGENIQLISDDYNSFEPIWSSDGTVFSTIRNSSFTGNPATNRTTFNGVKKISGDLLESVATHPASPNNQSTSTHRPTLIGSSIYYTRQENETTKETNLFKKTSTETRISNFNYNPTIAGVTYDGLFYSTVDSSETWVAFVSYQDNGVAAVPYNKNVVFNLHQMPTSGFITEGSDVWNVEALNDASSYDNVDVYRPCFSNDSTKIAYSKKVSGFFQIFVQDITAYTYSATNPTTGSDIYTFDNPPTQVTSGSYNSLIAGWSPDDTRLVINVDENTNGQICTINSNDGGDSVYLTDVSYNSWYGDWK